MKILSLLTIAAIFILPLHAYAGERSGSYQGKKGSGTYERNWSKESGTGTATRTRTNQQGKTATINKSYDKNDDGTVSVTGTRNGYNGRTQTMNNTITKTEDGHTSDKTYTGQDGRTVNIKRNHTR